MNKPPAFQFYPQDYLSSSRTAVMTLEEEGAYIRLLCYCWSIGSIPSDPAECAKLCGKGCSVETATSVQRAFNVRSTDGQRLLHDRLENEREKQEKHRESASFAGRKSAESRARKAATSSGDTTKNARSTPVQRNVNSSSSSSDEDESVLGKQKNRRCTSGGGDDQLFERFWQAYPRRTAKGHARKAWRAALKKVDAESLILKTSQFAKQQAGKEPQFIPHPASWLNAERWEDETLRPRDPFWFLELPDDEREFFVRAEMAKP